MLEYSVVATYSPRNYFRLALCENEKEEQGIVTVGEIIAIDSDTKLVDFAIIGTQKAKVRKDNDGQEYFMRGGSQYYIADFVRRTEPYSIKAYNADMAAVGHTLRGTVD